MLSGLCSLNLSGLSGLLGPVPAVQPEVVWVVRAVGGCPGLSRLAVVAVAGGGQRLVWWGGRGGSGGDGIRGGASDWAPNPKAQTLNPKP